MNPILGFLFIMFMSPLYAQTNVTITPLQTSKTTKKLIKKQRYVILDTPPLLFTNSDDSMCITTLPNAIILQYIETNKRRVKFNKGIHFIFSTHHDSIALISDPCKDQSIASSIYMNRIKNIKEYIVGEVATWQHNHLPTISIHYVNTDILYHYLTKQNIDYKKKLIDMRTSKECDKRHISQAVSLPLNKIYKHSNYILNTLNKNKSIYIYCNSRYLSLIAYSI